MFSPLNLKLYAVSICVSIFNVWLLYTASAMHGGSISIWKSAAVIFGSFLIASAFNFITHPAFREDRSRLKRVLASFLVVGLTILPSLPAHAFATYPIAKKVVKSVQFASHAIITYAQIPRCYDPAMGCQSGYLSNIFVTYTDGTWDAFYANGTNLAVVTHSFGCLRDRPVRNALGQQILLHTAGYVVNTDFDFRFQNETDGNTYVVGTKFDTVMPQSYIMPLNNYSYGYENPAKDISSGKCVPMARTKPDLSQYNGTIITINSASFNNLTQKQAAVKKGIVPMSFTCDNALSVAALLGAALGGALSLDASLAISASVGSLLGPEGAAAGIILGTWFAAQFGITTLGQAVGTSVAVAFASAVCSSVGDSHQRVGRYQDDTSPSPFYFIPNMGYWTVPTTPQDPVGVITTVSCCPPIPK